MNTIYMFFAALAPVLVLLWYIYRKDSMQPEPPRWLLRAFLYGIASVGVSLTVTSIMKALTGLNFNPDQTYSVLNSLVNAFVWAAIPEESAKLLMLWLLVRKNPFFDDRMDGIVYACCIGLGFAALENVMYLSEGLADGSWVGIGISRALFSVPGHFLFAVLMGYYYSLYYFGIRRNALTRILIWLAPVLAHALFDGILFSLHLSELTSVLGMILFLFFFGRLRRMGKSRIRRLRE